jgi:hypothetical protein|tara:strand:- start:76 stop:573 length:498 start_codon:yes stop_codon:yes gene_type:complete
MANTLETLGSASTVAVHRSGTDLKDKTPLQNYQGATVSALVTAARPTQGAEATTANDTSAVTAANILTGIVKCTPGSSDKTKATDTAANLISTLGLVADNDSFDFSFINLSTTHNVILSAGSGVTLLGQMGIFAQDTAADAISIGVGRFRVRRTSSTAVTIYRIG